MQVERHQLSSEAYRVRLRHSYCEVLDAWEKEATFRQQFSQLLADGEFPKFAWETPPLHEENLDQRFEFVVTASPNLSSSADPKAFSSHFRGASDSVLVLPNLGRDALLVVPTRHSPSASYAHLGAFLRTAPEDQQHCLWQQVCRAVRRRLGAKPIWLSTAGLGVRWLHVRVDSQPKYYRHAAYRRA